MLLQGAAHSEWANSNEQFRDVVEVIDAARDALGDDEMQKSAGIVDEEISSDSDSSDEHDYVPDGSPEHKQGPIDQVRDYKRRDKALHRQHRGLMQWKVRQITKRDEPGYERKLMLDVGAANGEMGKASGGQGGRYC